MGGIIRCCKRDYYLEKYYSANTILGALTVRETRVFFWPEGAVTLRQKQCFACLLSSPWAQWAFLSCCVKLCWLIRKHGFLFSIIMLMVQMVAWWVASSLIFSHCRLLVCRPTQTDTRSKSVFTPPTRSDVTLHFVFLLAHTSTLFTIKCIRFHLWIEIWQIGWRIIE